MDSIQYILTHFYRRTPTPQGWIDTVFITRHRGEDTHYLTFSKRPVPIEKINNDVANGSLIELGHEWVVSTNQAVWIAPDQSVYVADALKPKSGGAVRVFKDNILGAYDSIDLAVQENFDELHSSLEVYFGPSDWKILLSIIIKYIRNETITEERFGNVGYVLPKLEQKYEDQFHFFLRDNQMNYTGGELVFRNAFGFRQEWSPSILDKDDLKSYLTKSIF